MELNEIYAHWSEIAGEPGAEWGEDEIFAFFQRFRPDGKRVDEALLPLPNGRAVHERLLQIYAATRSGWTDGDTSAAYFVVRDPPLIESAAAESLVRNHLSRIAEISREAGVDELVGLLQSPTLTLSRESAPDSPVRHDTDLVIYDTLCDWVASLETDPTEVADLSEAFYSIACDYLLSWYAMWRWYAGGTQIVDPFEPCFQLWRHGIEYRFDGPSSATIYVPELT